MRAILRREPASLWTTPASRPWSWSAAGPVWQAGARAPLGGRGSLARAIAADHPQASAPALARGLRSAARSPRDLALLSLPSPRRGRHADRFRREEEQRFDVREFRFTPPPRRCCAAPDRPKSSSAPVHLAAAVRSYHGKIVTAGSAGPPCRTRSSKRAGRARRLRGRGGGGAAAKRSGGLCYT